MPEEPDRKRSRLWTATAIIVAPMLYVLSVGPVLRLELKETIPQWCRNVPIYAPIEWVREHGPEPITEAINWYIGVWNP
jgi:hypothetical protein